MHVVAEVIISLLLLNVLKNVSFGILLCRLVVFLCFPLFHCMFSAFFRHLGTPVFLLPDSKKATN